MRQIVQAHQEGIGHIETAVPISWLERTTKNRRESSGTKRNVKVKADAKIVKERKGPQIVNRTIYPGYDVYYTEDSMIGIAWADVVLK
jgi:hypothetical protein